MKMSDLLVAQVEQILDLDGLPQGAEGSTAAKGAKGTVLLVADLSSRHGNSDVMGLCKSSGRASDTWGFLSREVGTDRRHERRASPRDYTAVGGGFGSRDAISLFLSLSSWYGGDVCMVELEKANKRSVVLTTGPGDETMNG